MKEEKEFMSAFSVDIFGDNSGLDYNVVVKLNRLAAIPPTWNNLVVHFTVTESDIPFWLGRVKQKLTTPKEKWYRMNWEHLLT